MSCDEANAVADELVRNAVDTIRERLSDDVFRLHLTEVEASFRANRTHAAFSDRSLLEGLLRAEPSMWPMRLYLADTYLLTGEEDYFEREVAACLAQVKDSFVVVALFVFMTRLYVLRAPNIQKAASYVRETVMNNPSVAPYVRSIYIQTLLDAGQFEEAYLQLKTALFENNQMLTVEGLEILPILMARLGHWQDEEQITNSLAQYVRDQLREEERNHFLSSLVADVQEHEQQADMQTARFLMKIARATDRVINKI